MEFQSAKSSITISFSVRIEECESKGKLLFIFLDRRFPVKPYVFAFEDLKTEKVVSFDSGNGDLPECIVEPSILMEIYGSRKYERTYMIEKSIRLNFEKFKNLKVLNFGGGCRIFVGNRKIFKKSLAFYYYQRAPEFEMKNLMAEHMKITNYNMLRSMNFDRIKNYAIYARRDVRLDVPILTQLLSESVWLKGITNEGFWRNLLGVLKRSIELLEDLGPGDSHHLVHRKPRPFDVKTHWVDMLCLIPNRCMNYRTDWPQDIYHEPYYSNVGDCEDLTEVIMLLYSAFINFEFSSDEYELLQMKKWAKLYVPCFTFCLSRVGKFSVGGEEQPTGHVCALFVSKWLFSERVNVEKLKKLMLERDPKFMHEGNVDRDILIGESTSMVAPFLSNPRSPYEPYSVSEFKLISQLGKVVAFSNHEDVKDVLGVRTIGEPSRDFFKNFAILFTPYFNQLDRACGYNSFILGYSKKSDSDFLEKPSYGITLDELVRLSGKEETKSLHIVALPEITGKLLRLCKLFSNFLGHVPTMKYDETKQGFHSICANQNSFVKDVDTSAMDKLADDHKLSLGSKYEMLSYAHLSDQDASSDDIVRGMNSFLESNGLKVAYERWEVMKDLRGHFLMFYRKKCEQRLRIPTANGFLKHLYPEK